MIVGSLAMRRDRQVLVNAIRSASTCPRRAP